MVSIEDHLRDDEYNEEVQWEGKHVEDLIEKLIKSAEEEEGQTKKNTKNFREKGTHDKDPSLNVIINLSEAHLSLRTDWRPEIDVRWRKRIAAYFLSVGEKG